jgi:hypothetical protein
MKSLGNFINWAIILALFAGLSIGLPVFGFELAFGDSKLHYDAVAFLHGVPAANVYDRRKGEPHTDCDFLAVPIGKKSCHYEVTQDVDWHVRWHGVEYQFAGLSPEHPDWNSQLAFDRLTANDYCSGECQWGVVPHTSLAPQQPDGRPFPASVYLHWEKVQD